MANSKVTKDETGYHLMCSDCGIHLATASEERFLPKTAICPNCDNAMLDRIRNYNETRGHLYTTKLKRR